MEINSQSLWINKFPIHNIVGNKYDKGYLAIIGGNIYSGSVGASKLASYAALRSGAGLVSIISDKQTAPIYASSVMSIMIKTSDNIDKAIEDSRIKIILIGPGNGLNDKTKLNVLKILRLKKKVVIDADAISVFKSDPTVLFNAVNSEVVLTPHLGEFKRVFQLKSNLIESALDASRLSKSIIVLKGRDTIIASPEGKYVINKSAPKNLATAGSGDVLAGIISGFIAQGVEGFDACCMATYIHSKAAENFGVGMIAEDLLMEIPKILADLTEV